MTLRAALDLDALRECGLTPEQVLHVSLMLADAYARGRDDEREEQRKATRERVARHRNARNASNVTPAPSPDAPLSLPRTPTLTPLNPPSTPEKTSGKPDRSAEDEGEFEMLWAEFPRNPNSSKLKARKAYSRVARSERGNVLEGAIAYAEWLKTRKTDHPIMHLSTFLNEERWRGFIERMENVA